MGKNTIEYDPQFKIMNKNQVIHARQSLKSNHSKNKKLNSNRWTFIEQQKYKNFVQNNIQKFQNPKKWKIFFLMSKQIKTRKSEQCKTHHAKMIFKFNKSLSSLIESWSKIETISQNTVQILKQDYQTNLFFQQNNEQNQQAGEQVETYQKSIKEEEYQEQLNIFDVLTL